MTDQKLDLEALEATAKVATEGPWEVHRPIKRDRIVQERKFGRGVCGPGWTFLEQDAAHIAAFDPPTALAMIAEIRRLKKAFNSLSDKWSNERDEESIKLFRQKARADEAEKINEFVREALEGAGFQHLPALIKEFKKTVTERDALEARVGELEAENELMYAGRKCPSCGYHVTMNVATPESEADDE